MCSERTRDARLAFAFILVAASWAVTFVYTAHAALPHNPVALPGAQVVRAMQWMPEGWNFFTRNPQEERTFVYRRVAAGWEPASLAPHARATNLFGLDRQSRAQAIELARLLLRAHAEARPCQGDLFACLDASTPATVVVESKRSQLCGAIGIVRQRIPPWAWRRTQKSMPMKVMRIEVTC